jgi:hypothetical protein
VGALTMFLVIQPSANPPGQSAHPPVPRDIPRPPSAANARGIRERGTIDPNLISLGHGLALSVPGGKCVPGSDAFAAFRKTVSAFCELPMAGNRSSPAQSLFSGYVTIPACLLIRQTRYGRKEESFGSPRSVGPAWGARAASQVLLGPRGPHVTSVP